MRTLVLALLFGVALAPLAARAQDTNAEEASARARADFERGVAHAEAGEWEPALAAFEASLARFDRARTLFNVAVALDRLERGPDCVEALDRLLARDDVDPADREEAETLRRRWSSRLGTIVIRVAPPEARLAIDGRSIDGEGPVRRVLLSSGAHRVALDAPGHRPREAEVEVAAGGERRLEVSLEPAPVVGVIGALRMRPIDGATVRIVALRGVETVRPQALGEGATVAPLAAHGSGVIVHRDGWILTARHVVEGADHLVVLLPGQTHPLAARVAWRDPDRDLAFVRVSDPLEHAFALETPPSLVLGQAVDASGYPLDPSERWPNASSGQVGRPLNDGRVQLSIALNPGNSGGPIVADGHLIGVVSQGGDPGRGVQGVVVMEPVGPVVDALAQLLATPSERPSADPVDALLLELIGASAAPAVVRRLARLREVRESPPTDVRGALWALEAEATRRTILHDAGASMPSALPADVRALYDEATELAASLASGPLSQPLLASRYAPLGTLSSPTRSGDWECGPSGLCTQSIEPREPGVGWLFDFSLVGGVAIDDHPNASFVEGATFGALGLFHLGNIGRLDPIRFNVVLGAELAAGSWRSEALLTFLADVGVHLAIGDPRYAVSLSLLYTPGAIAAETRWSFAYLAYRATVALQLEWFGVGLSWREVGRGAYDTQRSLELLLSWGI